MKNTLFRIDDIGASTKWFNQHGKRRLRILGMDVPIPFANLWFFKRIWPLKAWGRYDELTADEWKPILVLFEQYKIVPVIAVTACWVERDSTLIPFYEKFPEEAALLKETFNRDKIVIANHGLTHCVVGKHLPKFWGSNRNMHREFLPTLDESVHRKHIVQSQTILEGFFGRPIEVFVPPGNVWSYKTYRALHGTNIKKVLSKNYMLDSNERMNGIDFQADADGQFPFHDRELKLFGVSWLAQQIKKYYS